MNKKPFEMPIVEYVEYEVEEIMDNSSYDSEIEDGGDYDL